jgi:hypothetical protein
MGGHMNPRKMQERRRKKYMPVSSWFQSLYANIRKIPDNKRILLFLPFIRAYRNL